MTALEQYIRLEAAGRWREGPDAPWREVLVSFGNASLVLSDFEEHPLTHWSLAAVEIVTREGTAVVYAPDPQAAELLEVSDAQMVHAIEAVSEMARSRAFPQRNRRKLRYLFLLVIVGLVALAAVRGPDILRARAFALVSDEQAEMMSDELRPRLAPTCSVPEGLRALATLIAQVAPGQKLEIRRWTSPPLSALPDGTLVLSKEVVEQAASPAVVAGWIALGAEAGPELSPFFRWTQTVPARDLISFLSSGDVGISGMRQMASMTKSATWHPDEEALSLSVERLKVLGVPFDEFLSDVATRLDITSPVSGAETTSSSARIFERDRDWVALQDVCGS